MEWWTTEELIFNPPEIKQQPNLDKRTAKTEEK